MFNFTCAFAKDKNGKETKISPVVEKTAEGCKVIISKEDISEDTEFLDVFPDMPVASAGNEGYFTMPYQRAGFLCEFKPVDNREQKYTRYQMPIYGYKLGKKAVLCVVSSMAWEYEIIIKTVNNVYYIFPRFNLRGMGAYEDIVIEYFYVEGENPGYVEIAARYRKYQLARGAFKPFCEKFKERPNLKNLTDSVNIRIRMGWKPVPAQIAEQTPENEPPMKAVVTFDRVCDIVDELKRQGVQKADLCLVGWNVKGHDGRYPQMFPVEEKLGGEEALKRAVKKVREAGYTINAHTNSTDAYSIADCFDIDDIIVDSQGNIAKGNFKWAGGIAYLLCPKQAYEKHIGKLDKVRELGFYGMHYIDVLGTVMPFECFHSSHKINKKQGAEYFRKMLKYASDLFGGASSEGVYDYLIDVLDFGLYACDNLLTEKENDPFICEKIPIFQLVYNDSVLSCPAGDLVNSTLGNKKKVLKVVEYGGKPAIYFNSQFMDLDKGGFVFLGDNDLLCDTDEHLRKSVAAVKRAEDLMKELEPIRYKAMTNHQKLEEGVFKTSYENGAYTVVNYNENDVEVQGITVKAMDFIVVK